MAADSRRYGSHDLRIQMREQRGIALS